MAAKLFLIDAHALCYRSFFAIKDLSTSKGRQTNAVYGFVNTLRKILREYQPQYMAVCFDSPGKTHRQEKFNAYKVQRPVMPRDLIDQMPVIKDVVTAYNLALFESPGFEADDIIATIARAAKDKDIEVVIVSDDKDMYQLAGERMSFFSARKDAIWEYQTLKEHLGFDPRRMTDFIALAGDNADNIPGVKGIGEVTARQLINDFGSLEDIFRHLDKIKSAKVREKLEQNREQAVLSKELAVLETGVPLDLRLECLKVREPQQNRLLEMFQELEFHRFAKELAAAGQTEEAHPDVQPLADKEKIGEWVRKIKTAGRFAVLAEGAARQLILSSGPTEHCAVTLDQMADWKEVFEDKGIEKVTYDLKETVKLLKAQDVALEGKVFDVFLAGYLAGNPQAQLNFMEQPPARRAALLWEMYPVLSKEVKEKSLKKLLSEIEIPLAFVLADMEICGVKLDIALLHGLSKECERKIGNLTQQIYRLSGKEFNLNSPKQLSRVLFEDLKLPTVKKTKTGFSTDEGVLTVLAPKHEVPALILEYRQLAKLKSTYIDALPALVNPKTGRVHALFHQTGTETGRLSSSQPNLQNIPIRTELGREIRKAFIPLKAGHVIVAADYSQIELRILAHITRDPGLVKAFQENQDIHAYTASLIFDVAEKDVTPQMRDNAKRVNFGIIYGMSAFGLAKDLGISQSDAQEFIDKYFSRYPKVKDFMDNAIRQCEEKGFVTTLLNRRRYIPEINSPNESMKQFARRQAINTPVQGSAADLMKLAMIDIHREIKKRKLASQILITVHDELVLDVPGEEKEEVVELLRGRMEHPFVSPEATQMELSVPIKVSVKTGANWLETKEA
ncbi:MAG TPA: DNA polymerase I [Candidatus Omnitrophica bacterium]|nr:DNA polymerase I [Candidatus Omnitrophota bacterium]